MKKDSHSATEETICLFLIISTIEQNDLESRKMWVDTLKTLPMHLISQKNNIIVFLLFYHNSIKIILCYKAEIKHLCTLGQFSQASGAKHGPQSDTNSLCRALHTRAASPLCPGQCGHWKALESWGFHAPPALHHSLCKATNTSHPHPCRSCIWLRAATCVNKDCPEEQQNATQVWLK